MRRDLVPALGRIRLTQLRPRHISAFTEARLAAGRGRTTVYRCTAALSSALGHAARIRLLARNPAVHSLMPRPVPPERLCWSPEQAAAFLAHNHAHYGDRFTDLFEVPLGPGSAGGVRPAPAGRSAAGGAAARDAVPNLGHALDQAGPHAGGLRAA